MIRLNPQELSQKLTLHVDGILSDDEKKEIEAYVAEHPDAQQELRELLKLKQLMSPKKVLEEDGAFWTRLSAELGKQREEEQNLLPFPRKYLPLVAVLSLAGIVFVGALAIQNRTPLWRFFREKSQAVKDVYEQNILKGSIFPFFSNVGKDQALQFALLGTLPLDAKAETALRVDEKADKGYRIEVGRTTRNKMLNVKPVTVERFLADIQATNQQRKVIDSLIDYTRNQIRTSVLVGENDVVAIDPNLTQLNKVMVSSIAGCLEEPQRVRMGKMLEDADAPYTFSWRGAKPTNPEKIFERIHRPLRVNSFVLITPDSTMSRRVQIDVDNVMRQFGRGMVTRDVEMRRERILRRFTAGEFPRVPKIGVSVETTPSLFGDSNFFRVDIERGWQELPPDPEELHVVVTPRVRKRITIESSRRGFNYRFFDDSTAPSEESRRAPQIRIFKQEPGDEPRLEFSDSIRSIEREVLRTEMKARKLDSLERSLQRESLKKRQNIDPGATPPAKKLAPNKKKREPVET